jgi:hypothetical protein
MADITTTQWDFANDFEGNIDLFIETLRDFKNPVTNQIADMLDPHGNTYWRLDLKKRRRGRPPSFPEVAWEYQEELKKYGNRRGAIKSVEGTLIDRRGITKEAIRSAVRRLSGTHGGRRKKKSGHK